MKEKNYSKFYFIKIKNFSLKDIVKKKRQATDLKKTFTQHKSNASNIVLY